MTTPDFLAYEHAQGAHLEQLLARAAETRDAAWGKVVTYSRKVFIPLTNLCRDRCGYCIFVKQPGEPGAGYLSPDQVMRIVKRGQELGCKEALFSLGEKPELRYPEAAAMLRDLGFQTTLEYTIAMCRMVLEQSSLVPHVNLGTMTPAEMAQVKHVSGSAGLMLENISRRLMQPGMAHHACPDKVPVQRIRTLQAAGSESIPTTTGILIGIGENWAERIKSLEKIAQIYEQHGHIQEVIVQNFRAKPGTSMARHQEPDLTDMLRTLAVARLILPASISLQAPPNLSEEFEAYLDAGINDWGGGIAADCRSHQPRASLARGGRDCISVEEKGVPASRTPHRLSEVPGPSRAISWQSTSSCTHAAGAGRRLCLVSGALPD